MQSDMNADLNLSQLMSIFMSHMCVKENDTYCEYYSFSILNTYTKLIKFKIDLWNIFPQNFDFK